MLLLIALGCISGGDSSDSDPTILGTVSTNEGSAEVEIYKAFGFNFEDAGLVYFSSSPTATCESVAEYLTEDKVDPTGIWPGGTCNLIVVANPWAGDMDVEVASGESNIELTWNLRCALGEGEFEWGTRGDQGNDTDYYWTGYDWTGSPGTYSLSLSGDGPYTADVTMGEFTGNYPDIIDSIPADGTVSGSVQASVCQDLYNAPVFP